jgi:hypothetical protein
LEKFDYDTSRIFEKGLEDSREIPQVTYILEFLSERFEALESMKTNKQFSQAAASNKREKTQSPLSTKIACPMPKLRWVSQPQ